MKLNEHEIETFRNEGYLSIKRRVVDDSHLATLRKHYDAVFDERRGTTGQGLRNLAVVEETEENKETDLSEEMLQIMEMWRLDEEYRKLLYHEPLLDIAEGLIGSEIQLFHDQALYKPAFHGGEVFWHQDNAYWQCAPPNLMSIWIALDDADEENGCMNVIPGSHLEGLTSHGRAKSEKGELPALLEVTVDEDRAVSVPVKAGCAMLHHCMTLHQTNPNRSSRHRRAMVIHYMASGTKNRDGVVMNDHLTLRSKLT